MSRSGESIIQKKPQKKRPRFRHLQLIVVVLIVFGAGGVSAFRYLFPAEQEFILNYYTYAEVAERDFSISVSANGTVIPEKEEVLRVQSSAIVTRLAVTEGDDVEEGQLLAELTSTEVSSRHASAQRRVDQAEQELERLRFDHAAEQESSQRDIAQQEQKVAELEKELALKQALYELGGVSRRELEQAEQALAAARDVLDRWIRQYEETLRRQDVAWQRAEDTLAEELAILQELAEEMAALSVYAPFSGRIVELGVSIGTSLSSGAAVLTVATVTDPLVQVQLDADVIDLVQVGHPAVIRTSMASYDGTVTYIAPRAVDVAGTPLVETHIRFASDTVDLRPASAVSVELEVDRRENSPFLPRGAYLSSGDQLFVYVLREDMAFRQDVRYGIVGSSAVEIVSGLEPGDRVITSSYDEFRHRTEVRVNSEGGRRL